MDIEQFRQLVIEKGDELYRGMRWRDDPSLYAVLTSEIMLQQTQVARVRVKFDEFMAAFPTVEALAGAELAAVLRVWQGLGYNRRAKFLHDAAKYIVAHGEPQTIDELVKLPGVGINTAGAIINYVYQIPTAFIETNIRTVYFQHFFDGNSQVTDGMLLKIVAETMDHQSPREWFWALMDYGAELKSQGQGRLDTSKHYKKQPPLKGSIREVRGQIVKQLSQGKQLHVDLESIVGGDERFEPALNGLMADGLIAQSGNFIHLTS